MGDADKVNTFSTPSKLVDTAKLKASKTDENGGNFFPPAPSFSNSNQIKEMEKISKKKILMERNEASELIFRDTLLPDNPNIDRRPPSAAARKVVSGYRDNSMSQTTSSSPDSEFDGDEENSLARPYDPLTNYISPRPKFLRYKPNRLREIFLRQENDRQEEENPGFNEIEQEDYGLENERLEEIEGVFDEIHDPVTEKEEEEEEEEEEHMGWIQSVKKLLKLLLITASLVFSTLYITSMNMSTAPSFEVSEAFKSEFFPILNNTSELAMESMMETVSNVWGKVTDSAPMVEFEDERSLWENAALIEVERDGDMMKEAEGKPEAETGENCDDHLVEDQRDKAEFLEQTVEDGDDGSEIVEDYEAFDIPETSEFTETRNPTVIDDCFNQDDDLVSDMLGASELALRPSMEEVEIVKTRDEKIIESTTKETENFVNDVISLSISVEKLKSELIELMHHTKPFPEVFIGLLTSSVILTCLILAFHFKKKKDERDSVISLSVKPLEPKEMITKEGSHWSEPEPLLSSEHDIERVDSFKTFSSSSIHSNDDEIERLNELNHQFAAPTVQLLGEFEVGEVSSSSLKNKIILKNRTAMKKNDIISLSFSDEEKPLKKKKMQSQANTNEQALTEFSVMTSPSPSYGSFTTEKKIIINKEVKGDGEMKLITTPVRRSTRIRNRVISP